MKNATLAAALIAMTAMTMSTAAQLSPASGTAAQPPGAVASNGSFDGSLAADMAGMQLLGVIEYGDDVLLLVVPGNGHGGGGYPGCFRTVNGVICYDTMLVRIEPGNDGYIASAHVMKTDGTLQQVSPDIDITVSQVDTLEMVAAHAISLSADPAP